MKKFSSNKSNEKIMKTWLKIIKKLPKNS